MKISKNSNKPKVISATLATISAAVFGWLWLPSLWFWICWEVFAGALVVVGCFGEWYLFKTPATPEGEDLHRAKELQFIFVVAIGVTMELAGLAHSIPEAMRLERDVSLANERVSTNEFRVEVLRSNNLVLNSQLLSASNKLEETLEFAARMRMKLIAPRALHFDETKFMADLSGRPKGAVAIFVTSGNKQDSILAIKIERALKQSGWAVIPSTPIPDELLAQKSEFSMGNILLTKKMPELLTDWVEHPRTNSAGSFAITNLWRMDTPERAFRIALGDCGVWVGMMMENTNLPEGHMQLVLGIEQW